MIRELPDGLEAKFHHKHGVTRDAPLRALTGEEIIRGHSTRCEIRRLREDGEYETVAVAYAYCNPKDQFEKRLGRMISLGRALKILETQP